MTSSALISLRFLALDPGRLWQGEGGRANSPPRSLLEKKQIREERSASPKPRRRLLPQSIGSNRSSAEVIPSESTWSFGPVRSGIFSPREPSMLSMSGSSWSRQTTVGKSYSGVEWSRKRGGGPVERGAHFYRSLSLDAHGNPIDKRNAWAARAVVYVNLIPPGAADTVHFRLEIPEDAGPEIHLEAKVHYRKFAWSNTRFSYAGIRESGSGALTPDYDDGTWRFDGDTANVSGELKQIPELPIVTLAEDRVTLRVVDAEAAVDEEEIVIDTADWERWNDYGIGLLLQGDLKGAEAAFGRATDADPENVDGWVNIGRVRVREGNPEGAREVLERALAMEPDLARANFFFARVLRDEGNFDQALEHLGRVTAGYPRDRVVWNEIGRIRFLQRRYEDAVVALRRVLEIDPEDLMAHYNLMLSYSGLNDEDRAVEHQQFYLRFKADESAQAITGRYLREHPGRQPGTSADSRTRFGAPPRTFPTPGNDRVGDINERWRQAVRGAPGLVLILSTLFAPPSALTGQDMSTIRFESITGAAGIDFTHNSGASGNRYLPETMGPGAGFMDYNGDGWPDIILVNGTHWPGESGPASTPKLYGNNKDGTFSDVTEAAGLAVEMYGMGVGVADYDNDGDQDLFLSALGQNRLYRNDGAGTFADRTSQAGMLGPEEFSTSVAWSDYDGMAMLTCLSPITSNGLSKAIYTARWTEPGNPIARLNPTAEFRCGSGVTMAMARFEMPPGRRVSSTPIRRAWV